MTVYKKQIRCKTIFIYNTQQKNIIYSIDYVFYDNFLIHFPKLQHPIRGFLHGFADGVGGQAGVNHRRAG